MNTRPENILTMQYEDIVVKFKKIKKLLQNLLTKHNGCCIIHEEKRSRTSPFSPYCNQAR